MIALWVAAHYFRRNLSYIGFDGSGRQVRDFLHIDDFCELLLEQIGDFETYHGRLFNVGGGLAFSLSLQETTRLCEEITGNRLQIAAGGRNPSRRRSDLSDRPPAPDGGERLAAAARCPRHARRYLQLDSRGGRAGAVHAGISTSMSHAFNRRRKT